jgi:hypothetical protein
MLCYFFLSRRSQSEVEAVRRESEETLQAVQAALDDTQSQAAQQVVSCVG